MNKNLEIERKFLLKRTPNFDINEVDIISIHQIYVDVDGKVTRFRMSEKIGGKNDNFVKKYHQCNKKFISSGVFEEVEESISEKLFREMCQKNHTYINKTRYVYECDGLNWEVDEYSNLKLITLEVELDDINQKITIPELIEKEIIIEVTGQKMFSNQNLSIKN